VICFVSVIQRLLGTAYKLFWRHWYYLTSWVIPGALEHHKVIPFLQHTVKMTSPGRTHIPWFDQTGQINELLSYIGFLEAKVSYLQQHHERCNSWSPDPMILVPDVPYLPPDVIVNKESGDLVESTFDQSIQTQSPSPTSISPTTSIKPPLKAPPVNNPRWKRIVDQLTAGWDDPRAWTMKRASLGLDSIDQNNRALMLILGLQNCIPTEWNQSPLCVKDIQSVTSTTDSLILSARQYALDTKASGTNSVFVTQIHNFRELVFASLCVVMEQQGLPINTINDLMRICMSSSGAANLYRLRRGALWVNRVIRGLIVKGWGHGATELFLLCKNLRQVQLQLHLPNLEEGG
jgi:hypothetical protein